MRNQFFTLMENSMKAVMLGLMLVPSLSFAKEVMRCNNGALSVTVDAKNSGKYLATVSDTGTVNWFESETKKTVVLVDSMNNTVSIQKIMNYMQKFEIVNGKKILKVSDFHFYPETKYFATSGGPGSYLVPAGKGYKLQLNAGKMTSSHSVVNYEIGSWTFENCKLSL
jgi:hypothetical protein